MMKRLFKISVLVVSSAFLLAQLIPRPEKNISKIESGSDISKALYLPDSVRRIFVKSCYDCHSNHTQYPWYASIQPIALLINRHIEEGKEELNFSEFSGYEKNKQVKKLEEIEEVVGEEEMPLKSYTLIHRKASLNDTEKKAITAWAQSALQIISGSDKNESHEENKNNN